MPIKALHKGFKLPSAGGGRGGALYSAENDWGNIECMIVIHPAGTPCTALTVVAGTPFPFCFSRIQVNVNAGLFDIHTQFQAPLSQQSFEINTDIGICLPGEKVFAKIVGLVSPI